MTKGRLVMISTERLGGGSPAHQLFAVAIDDNSAAIAAVKRKKSTTPDQEVWVLSELSERALTGLGLIEEEVKEAQLW